MPDPPPPGERERLEALLEENLDRIREVVSWVARRFAMSLDEADELLSRVHLKLVEDDYRVLRAYTGRSGLPTYLVAVIQNLARDYRTERWGRWRPSAAADRLGLVAVQLETLVERDGFTLDEAIEQLRANHGVRMSRQELVDLATRLPRRARLEFEGGAERLAVAPGQTDEGLRAAEGERIVTRARQALREALGELELEDRLVLKMHYQSGLTIAAIAAALGLDQRRLYTRRDRCHRQLRRALEKNQVDSGEVLAALGWSRVELEVDYGVGAPELDGTDPSNPAKARVRRER